MEDERLCHLTLVRILVLDSSEIEQTKRPLKMAGRLWWAVAIIDTLVNSDKGIQISIAVQSSILCLQLDTFQIIDKFIFSYMQPWCFYGLFVNVELELQMSVRS